MIMLLLSSFGFSPSHMVSDISMASMAGNKYAPTLGAGHRLNINIPLSLMSKGFIAKTTTKKTSKWYVKWGKRPRLAHYNKQQNPCSKGIETSLSTLHRSTDQLLFPAHTSHIHLTYDVPISPLMLPRGGLSGVWVTATGWHTKKAGEDSSFKYHHPRLEGLQFLGLPYNLNPLSFIQGAACMFLFIERQALAPLHLERARRKREAGYHWSCSRFNYMIKWDLWSANIPLTTRQDHDRSWKHTMEVCKLT